MSVQQPSDSLVHRKLVVPIISATWHFSLKSKVDMEGMTLHLGAQWPLQLRLSTLNLDELNKTHFFNLIKFIFLRKVN